MNDVTVSAQTQADVAAAALLAGTNVNTPSGGSFTTITPDGPPPPPASSPAFTQEDIVKARQEEKSKLYSEIDSLKQENAAFKEQQEAAQRAEAERVAALQAEEERKKEEEMDVRQLLEKKEQEWAAQLNAERVERETALSLLEQERKYQQVQEYRTQRIEQERDDILPELIDLVAGDSPDQIEASITGLKERSLRILDSAQQAAQVARRDLSGARVTAPLAEPLENYSNNKSFTPDQLRNMTMDEYAQYRSSLLGGDQGGRGLFG